MPLYRDEGVVLRTTKLGEADRIVTLLTRSHGKIRAVAKGVRRVKSRFGGRLEPFMRVDVLIATGRTLDVVSQAESISAYAAQICADYGAYGIANVMVETADKLVSAEGERAERAGASRASGGGDRGILCVACVGFGRVDSAAAFMRGVRTACRRLAGRRGERR